MAQHETASKGRGWHGDPAGHARAGKKGGQKVASERGSEFYENIGRQGGKASSGSFEKGSKRAREAGRRGGQARSSGRDA